MSNIASITCDKFINSRGRWTVHTKVSLTDGSVGVQTVPEGASTGEFEAVSIDVETAVPNVSGPINIALSGESALEQKVIDSILIKLDGTSNKKRLGANAILSVSLAVAKAAAISKGVELYEYLKDLYGNSNSLKFPTPVFNVLNGGKHACNGLSFQEFMVIPAQFMPFDKAVEVGMVVYNTLKSLLEKQKLDVAVGDEGGFAPRGLTTAKALALIREAAGKEYTFGREVFLGMDVAAGSFYSGGKYDIPEENKVLDSKKLDAYYDKLLKKFEVIYLEDPYYERDLDGWRRLMARYSDKLMVVADDLVVTNVSILKKAIDAHLANAVIVKPNQIGTLTETLEFVKMAQSMDMAITVSHRSGETAEDTFIADLALAVGADFIKAGAPARGERVAKYNRLLDVFYSTKKAELS